MVNIKFGDVVAGVAKSLDRQLTDSLEETRELSRSARERAMARDEIAWQTYSKNKEETEVIIEELASIAKKQNVQLPEGYTYYDYAGQLFSSAGSIASATQLAADIREGERLNLGMDGIVKFGDMQSGGMGFADVVNQLVRRPTKFTQPPGKVMGVGLLSNVDITDKITSAMDIPSSVPAAPEKRDFGTATIDYSRLRAAREFGQEQEMFKLKKQSAILGNKMQAAQLKELGVVFDSADLRKSYENLRDSELESAGYGIDPETNERVMLTSKEAKEAGFGAYAKGLKRATEVGQANGSLQGDSNKVKQNRAEIATIAGETLAFVQELDKQIKPYVTDGTVTLSVGEMYRKTDGSVVLHLGAGIEPIVVRQGS